jgi:hypothetical protein
MSKEIIYQNIEKEAIINDNTSKPNYTIKIDDIINKYRTQLEKIKTNSSIENKVSNNGNLIILTNIPKNTIPPTITTQSITKNKETITNSQTKFHKFSSELTEEIQHDNIKLQSSLTAEKLKVAKLNSQVENYELELKKAQEEIIQLKNKLEYKEKELVEQINNINNINNNINNDINKIKAENNLNKNIIQKFFEIFNKNIDLLKKSNLIPLENNSTINFLENDYEGKNQKLPSLVIKSIDCLINKLLTDNKELYEQIVEIKKILDQQNNIQRELEQIKNIKEENLIIKEKYKSFVQENEILKKENAKLANRIKELNENENINSFIKNNIENNNKILNNFNNDNNQKLSFSPNARNTFYNNYRRSRINSYYNHNNNSQNYSQNCNRNNFTYKANENDDNNERSIKNINDYYNYSRRNSKNNLKKNIINNNINNNYNNKNNFNIEGRKINLSEFSNIDNIYNTYDYNNQNENPNFSLTGFGRSKDKINNKIMILDQ